MIANLFSPLLAKALAVVAGALLITVGMQRCTIERLEKKLSVSVALRLQERDNHRSTKATYRNAQERAQRASEANLEKVARARSAITERTIDDLENRRRNADARYRRLLEQARAGVEGVASDADLSAVAAATCRAYAATECDELPAKLKSAQDNTDQLIALQGWVAENATVTTTPTERNEP